MRFRALAIVSVLLFVLLTLLFTPTVDASPNHTSKGAKNEVVVLVRHLRVSKSRQPARAFMGTRHPPDVSPTIKAEWQRVSNCEEGGDWAHWTWWYPDGLGIDRPNFIQFGGNPNRVNSVTQQIFVGQRFVAYYHISIPDRYVCGPY